MTLKMGKNKIDFILRIKEELNTDLLQKTKNTLHILFIYS